MQLTNNGAAVTGASVTFGVTSGSGSLSLTSATTDASGFAQVAVTAGATPGALAIRAAYSTKSVDFNLTVQNQGYVLSSVAGNNQNAIVSTAFAPLRVLLLNNGNPVSGATVNYSILSGATGSFSSGGTATTDVNGNAQIVFTAGSSPGSTTVQATSNGKAANFNLTIDNTGVVLV